MYPGAALYVPSPHVRSEGPREASTARRCERVFGPSCLECGYSTRGALRGEATIGRMGLVRRRGPWLGLAVVLGCAVVVAGVLAAVGEGRWEASTAGSPARGRTAYLARGCGGCHDAGPVGNEQTSGPKLERKSMARNAAATGKKLGPYVLESIVAPRAFAVPGYSSGVMPSYARLPTRELDDLVSYLIGQPYTSARIPRRPLSQCDASPRCRRAVARWQRELELPKSAVPGAKIFAVTDCRSCHAYAGTGATRSSAPDLTRQAARRRSLAWLVRKLRCPECSKPGSGMPSYAALGEGNLQLVAAFLRESKGARR